MACSGSARTSGREGSDGYSSQASQFAARGVGHDDAAVLVGDGVGGAVARAQHQPEGFLPHGDNGGLLAIEDGDVLTGQRDLVGGDRPVIVRVTAPSEVSSRTVPSAVPSASVPSVRVRTLCTSPSTGVSVSAPVVTSIRSTRPGAATSTSPGLPCDSDAPTARRPTVRGAVGAAGSISESAVPAVSRAARRPVEFSASEGFRRRRREDLTDRVRGSGRGELRWPGPWSGHRNRRPHHCTRSTTPKPPRRPTQRRPSHEGACTELLQSARGDSLDHHLTMMTHQ